MARANKISSALPALLLLLLCIMVTNGDGAQAPAPATDHCLDLITGMVDCLGFVQAGGTSSEPCKQCCSGLKQVVKVDVKCLCDAFQQGANFGITLNMTRALALPSACGVSTPPASKCNLALGDVPAAAPAPSAPMTTIGAPSPASESPKSGKAFINVPSIMFISSAIAVIISNYYMS